jgi:hypothetical protein
MGPLAQRFVDPRLWTLLQRDFPDRSAADLGTHLEECLKFLIIASESKGCFIPLTKELDETWHALMVQTRLYAQLCANLPGGTFVHHESLDLSEYVERFGQARAIREFVNWIPLYVSHFGEFTEKQAACWRVCGFLRDEVGMTLDQINDLGRIAATR